jgi:TP901 family phage tail tape measure protein
MPEDSVVRTMAVISMSYEPAKKASEDFNRTLAKLDADLTKLQATAMKGLNIPDLTTVAQFVQQMRTAVASGRQLTEEERKMVAAAEQYAFIQGQNVVKQQAITKAVADQSKTTQSLATVEARLATQRALAEQKANERTFLKIPALQAELAAMQHAVTNRGLESSELATQINLERQKINLLEQQRVTGTQITAGMREQTAEIEKNVAVLKSNLHTATADMGASKGGETFWERRFGWFVAGTAFYGSMRLIREAIDNMANIESKMTVIRRVSNEATADFGEMQSQLLALGVELGQTWDDVSDIAVSWSQAGYNMADTIDLTRVSLLAMNTAELTAQEATSGMIAIMAQWNLQANELLPVLDKINRTADDYSASSSDLINGLSRSSAAAKQMGVSLDETIALLTILRESSGRTGKEVGNALNTLLAYIKRPLTRQALEDIGIQVWADDTKTQMRSVMDILKDVSVVWNGMSEDAKKSLADSSLDVANYADQMEDLTDTTKSLTQAEQMRLGQAMAGVRRQNYLNILMEGFSKTQLIVLNMERALGYSVRENAMYLETYEGKVRQLRAAWEQASTALAQSGIFDILKTSVDTGRSMLEVFNSLPAPIRAATTALLAYNGVLMATRMLKKTLDIDIIGGVGTAVGSLVSQIPALSGIGSFLGGLGGPLAIVAGGTGLLALFREMAETDRQLGVMVTAYHEAEKALSELKEGTDEYNDAQDDMQTIMNAIGDAFPSLIVKVDESGNVAELATGSFKRFKEALEDIKNPAEDVQDEIQKVTNKIQALREIIASKTIGGYSTGVLPGDIPPSPGQEDYALQYGAYSRDQLEHEIEVLERRLAVLRGEETKIVTGQGGGASGSGLPFDYDSWKSRFDDILKKTDKYNLSMIAIRENVRLTALEEDRLRDSMASTAEVEAAASRSSSALASENMKLSEINDTLYAQLDLLRGMKSEAQAVIASPVTDEALEDALRAYDQAQSKIESLTREISDNTVKIRENEIAIEKSGRSVKEYYEKMTQEAKKAYEQSYSLTKKTFDHQVRMFNTSRDLQIAHYRSLLTMYQDDREKRWEIEETLQRLYRDALEEETDKVKEAYRDRLKALEESMDKEIAKYQRKIDALDDIEKKSDRSEAARQHSEKIKELEEKIAYERLRTGIEHERNITDYTKQIQEENIRWELQREQWARDDKRKGYEEEIEDIKNSYDKKREELEKAWKETEAFLNNEFVTVLSMASVFDDSWYQKGLDWADRLVQGFQKGMSGFELGDMTGDIRQNVSRAGSSSSSRAANEALLAAKRAWERAHSSGDIQGMRNAEAAAKAIRASHSTLDPHNQMSADELEAAIRGASFDTGGFALTGGWARLHPGELVLKADVSSDILKNLRTSTSTSKVVYNITSPLVRFDRVEVSDRADADYIITTVDRHIKDIMRGKGGSAAS